MKMAWRHLCATRDRTGEQVRLVVDEPFQVLRLLDFDRLRREVVGDERVLVR